jgi:exonuclease VII small subunit
MAANHKESNVLDLGGYGVVIYPALENEDSNNEEPFYPKNYITKVFYRKEDYDDLLRKKKTLRKILGKTNEGSQFETYKKEWHGRNLPKNALKKIYNEISLNSNQPVPIHQYENVQFYPIRMKHLGKSYGSLRHDKKTIQELRECSIEYLIKSMQGVFHILSKLSEKGYLHGDIHSENVMIYHAGNFCEFYVIDYDLLRSFSDLKKMYTSNYPLYGAPECYHLLSTAIQSNKENDLLGNYIFKVFLHNEYLKHLYGSLQSFEERVRQTLHSHANQSSVSVETFDSFLLCLLMLDLLFRLYPFLFTNNQSTVSEAEEKRLHDVKDILEEGSTLIAKGRKTPTQIKEKLDQILRGNQTVKVNHKNKVNNTVKVNQKNKNKNSACSIMGGCYPRRQKRKTNKRRR